MSANLLLLATLLPVILNFGCILMYLIYQKCRVRTQEEGSADWDDVIWFRCRAKEQRGRDHECWILFCPPRLCRFVQLTPAFLFLSELSQ